MRVIFFFLQVIACFWLKRNRIARTDLFGKFSFRYKETEARSLFSVPQGLLRSFRLLWENPLRVVAEKNPASEIVVFDSGDHFSVRAGYLANILPVGFFYYIRGFYAEKVSGTYRLLFSILLFIVSVPMFLFSFFVGKRANVGFVLVELTEHFLFSVYLERHPGIRKVIVFSAYEKDVSLLSAFLISKMRKTVQWVPSSNPLRNFYTQGICDILSLTLSSQKQELEKFRSRWILKEVVYWPPFGYEEVIQFIGRSQKVDSKSLGFFSSGNWLRERESHGSLNLNEREAEGLLLVSLSKFAKAHPEYTLYIYLHPLEKRAVYLNDSILFFQNIFGDSVRFAPVTEPSALNFDKVNLGISVYSSVMFQRLFMGMKVLFAPFNMPYNYFGDVRLENISIRDKHYFSSTLLDIVAMADDEYFSRFELHDYSFGRYSDVLVSKFDRVGA